MEERKYTFYDRYQKVKYANITVEELEVKLWKQLHIIKDNTASKKSA